MKNKIKALKCSNLTVRFPISKNTSYWQLAFNLVKNIKWYIALKSINLEVPKGKIVGVIGRNGAGKSTLLRAIAGVYPLHKGSIARLGPVTALFELGGSGGFLLTGTQYIKRWLRLNGIPKKLWNVYIDEVRDFSELGDRLEDRIFTYSAGMAARLYFSTATSTKHDIYLIDEILSVGDEHFQAKCWSRVRKRLSDGVSGILVTHDWPAILRLCEQAHEIRQGKLLYSGNAEKVIFKYINTKALLAQKPLAFFSSELPNVFGGVTGKEFSCLIPIVIKKEIPVYFSYSIEKLILGKDWQIIMLTDDTFITSSKGEHQIKISIPKLPLPNGLYRLNLFLNGEKPHDGGMKEAFDVRSWLSGNSISLNVKGNKTRGITSIEPVIKYI